MVVLLGSIEWKSHELFTLSRQLSGNVRFCVTRRFAGAHTQERSVLRATALERSLRTFSFSAPKMTSSPYAAAHQRRRQVACMLYPLLMKLPASDSLGWRRGAISFFSESPSSYEGIFTRIKCVFCLKSIRSHGSTYIDHVQ